MINNSKRLVITEDRLCLSCGHRGHISEWEMSSQYSYLQVDRCPNCGCKGCDVMVLDESEVEELRVLDG